MIPAAQLVAFLRAHPLVASATGSASGLGTWFLAEAENLALIFRLVGGFFGCLLTVLCFLFALPRAVRFFRNWRRRGFARADGDEPPFLPR